MISYTNKWRDLKNGERKTNIAAYLEFENQTGDYNIYISLII